MTGMTVVAADGLIKRDLFRRPDPFVVISVDDAQIHTTSIVRKTLTPYWNEDFVVSVLLAHPYIFKLRVPNTLSQQSYKLLHHHIPGFRF